MLTVKRTGRCRYFKESFQKPLSAETTADAPGVHAPAPAPAPAPSPALIAAKRELSEVKEVYGKRKASLSPEEQEAEEATIAELQSKVDKLDAAENGAATPNDGGGGFNATVVVIVGVLVVSIAVAGVVWIKYRIPVVGPSRRELYHAATADEEDAIPQTGMTRSRHDSVSE